MSESKKGISVTIPRWIIQVLMLVAIVLATVAIFILGGNKSSPMIEIIAPAASGLTMGALMLTYRLFLRWMWGVNK